MSNADASDSLLAFESSHVGYGTESESLQTRNNHHATSSVVQSARSEHDDSYITTSGEEFNIILLNSLPLCVTFLLQTSISSVSLLFIGRLGPLELGAVTLANVTLGMTTAIFIGLATCLDTLCPQAYGAQQYKLVGLYFQRCVAISFIVAIPIAFFWFFSSRIFALMVEDQQIINISSRYLRFLICAIPGFIFFECGKKYLQAQGDFTSGQYILLSCTPINVLFNYLFIVKLNLGYIGAPFAITITYNSMGCLLILAIYLRRQKAKRLQDKTDCWHEMSMSIFHDWRPMIAFAIPGIVMIEAEFFAFEMLTVVSARFGTLMLAAQSVAASIQTITFQIPFSVGVTASNRIAFHIGSGNATNCHIATRCTLLYMGCLIGVTNFLLLMFGRYPISRFFTNDQQVIAKSMQLLPIIAVNQLWDAYNVLSAGCLRAQGRQRIGGYLNLLAYYVIGLPLALLLGFKFKLEAQGLWLGLGIGVLVLSVSEMYCVYTSDWKSIIKRSQSMHKT